MARAILAILVALLTVSTPRAALAVGVSPGAATPVQREQSQARFVRGKQLFDAKKYDDALLEFRAAMDIVASPNARLYVARCLRETGRMVEAYVEFDRTAVEANEHAREDSRYARTGSSARAERDAIAPRIGFLTAHVDHASGATRLHIAGEEIRQAGWNEPVPVMPGDTEVVVETPPSAPVRKTVTLAAGEKKSITVDAVGAGDIPVVVAAGAPSSDRRSFRPYAYVAGGIGAAGLVTFAIAGVLSDSTYGDLSSKCGSGPCPPSRASEVSKGETEQTVADIGLGIGLAGLALGAALFLVSMPPKTGERAPDPATASAAVTIAPGGLGVRGTF